MTNYNSISIDLNDRNSDKVISEKLSELKNEGNSHVDLEVINWLPEKIQKMKINVDLFKKIKTIQELPDWVIIKILLTEGVLENKDFNKRIVND